MLAAHMDEVGLMVVSIEKSGHLKFKPVGGIDSGSWLPSGCGSAPPLFPGDRGEGRAPAKEDERYKPYEIEDLAIDIGAANKEEAEALVKIGDYVTLTLPPPP